MSADTQLRMHRDHQNWQSESAFWRDQVREWQQQTAQTAAEMQSLRTALQAHERKLETHAAAIHLYDQKCAEHECGLAETPTSATDVLARCAHDLEARHHHELRERHENLKQLHHSLMARWRLLLQSLRAES